MNYKDLGFNPVWFDSMGAKSTCSLVKTPDTSICIDPGIAAMQPSYPLPDVLKAYYRFKGKREIRGAVDEAEHVAISHYHYDHLITDPGIYDGKELWVKDPNRWINKSQWGRAREFIQNLAEDKKEELEEIDPEEREFGDPYRELDKARNKDFGDYQERREELLEKWRKRFRNLTEHWRSNPWIQEPDFLNYADGRGFEEGNTKVRFKGPLFHGIEYSKTGWVFSTVIETQEAKLIHSSDLQGPTIEDYADWIIEEDPDILVLDGPATYLLGHLLNKTNLRRSVDNARRILKEVNPELMVWDHHLLRERKYRERTGKVWELKDEYNLKTASEVKGEEPLIDRAENWSSKKVEEMKNRARKVLG
ncbi:MAG: MBL fold metallo-hydrolase [Candidatus Aenigmatarchaeota archaeon]